MKLKLIGLLKCIFFLSILFAIIIGIPYLLIKYTDTGREFITSTITSKYSKEVSVVIPYGIVRGINYYFTLSNGDTVSSSASDFNSLDIGDSYSYWRWKK